MWEHADFSAIGGRVLGRRNTATAISGAILALLALTAFGGPASHATDGTPTDATAQAVGLTDTCGVALVPIPEADQVVPVRVGDMSLETPFTVPGAYELAVSADGTRVWVVTDEASSPAWAIRTLDLRSGDLGVPVTLDWVPDSGPISNLVLSPDESTLYVGTLTELHALDPQSLATVAQWSYEPSFVGGPIALSSDGHTMVIGNGGDLMDTMVLDTRTPGPGTVVSTVIWPSLSISADGRTAYVASAFQDTVATLDLASASMLTVWPSPIHGPYGIFVIPGAGAATLVSNTKVDTVDLTTGVAGPALGVGNSGVTTEASLLPDGRSVLLADADHLWKLDTVTGAATAAVQLPEFAFRPAVVAPGQAPTAVLDPSSGLAGQATMLDGSASTPTCGEISAYTWDFGDGTAPQTTTEPTVQHVYAMSGIYEATLTVTDDSGTSTTQVFTGQSMVRNGAPQAAQSSPVVVSPALPRFTG